MHYDACPLGHAKLETTALYTRVAVSTIREVKSQLERLGVNLASRSPPAWTCGWPHGGGLAWRSPTSFAPMARRGARPTPAMSSLAQLKVMSGDRDLVAPLAARREHVERCEDWRRTNASPYNSCRNRHCPEVFQGAAARQWLAERESGALLPVPYYRATSSSRCRRLRSARSRSRTRRALYDLLFKVCSRDADHHCRRPRSIWARASASPPCCTPGARRSTHIIARAACPRHRSRRRPGRRTGRAGSPASPASSCPCACCRASFRRLFLEGLAASRTRLAAAAFFGDLPPLADERAFDAVLHASAPDRVGRLRQATLRRTPGRSRLPRRATPIASPSRTRRLIALDEAGVTFKWKNYRIKGRGRGKGAP